MRNTRWLRYGLASIIVAGTGLGATLTACGDDDSAGSSSGNVPDAKAATRTSETRAARRTPPMGPQADHRQVTSSTPPPTWAPTRP